MNKRGTQTNGPENKEVDEYAQGLMSNRWQREYVSRKEKERGLASIEDCIDSWTQWFENYIKKSKERLIIAAKNSIGNIDKNFKKITKTRKQKWEEK